jgi:hypothetical protein
LYDAAYGGLYIQGNPVFYIEIFGHEDREHICSHNVFRNDYIFRGRGGVTTAKYSREEAEDAAHVEGRGKREAEYRDKGDKADLSTYVFHK